MKKVRILCFLLVFLLIGSLVFANNFPFKPGSEPKGFRGIKWGANISTLSGMEYLETEYTKEGQVKWYLRQGDGLKIGDAEVESIEYGFWEGKLLAVTITTKGLHNFMKVKNAVFAKFGVGHKTKPPKEIYAWLGFESNIILKYDKNTKTGKLYMISKSMRIQMKKPKKQHVYSAMVASPLGFTIGKATVNEVRALLRSKKVPYDEYKSSVSHGPGIYTKTYMGLPADNIDSLGIKGLENIDFIFDAEGILIYVEMRLSIIFTTRKIIFDHLSKKYHLVKKKLNLIGDIIYAEFKADNATIIAGYFHDKDGTDNAWYYVEYMHKRYIKMKTAAERAEAEREKKRIKKERRQF
ncbi:MAG: hypothetical protein JRI46_01370 [Deltaproteobacteria bacterium]|nr:hypothetical protein [Deltaproteobacteria bacterium]